MDNPGALIRFVAGRIVLTLLSLLFLWFGIDLLRAAYRMNSPFEFIATFFASNLIILISAVLCLGFVLAIIRRFRPGKEENPEEAEEGRTETETESYQEKGPVDES